MRALAFGFLVIIMALSIIAVIAIPLIAPFAAETVVSWLLALFLAIAGGVCLDILLKVDMREAHAESVKRKSASDDLRDVRCPNCNNTIVLLAYYPYAITVTCIGCNRQYKVYPKRQGRRRF